MLLLLLACCLSASGQRYAERNVLPADTFVPSSDPSVYDYNYENDQYGFEEQPHPDVFKWNVEEFPHPESTPRFCNRMRASRVCDPDLVLEKEQADMLDKTIQKLYRETPCICEACSGDDGGIVVGIALLKHMYHPYNVHPAKVIRSFAETLRFRWKLGRCENDILIVVATTDRLSYTDVGEATSDYLTIHEAHRIFLENKAKFSASNFSEGLMDILGGYHRATRTMMQRAMRLKKEEEDTNLGVVAGAIVGSVLLLGILLFIGFVVYRRCRTVKDASDDEEESVPDKGSRVSTSWTKKDIKVLFGGGSDTKSKGAPPARSDARYQKCGTDDTAPQPDDDEGEETMDFTLATPDDTSFPDDTRAATRASPESEVLDSELAKAAEGIARTFPAKSESSVLMTDM